MTEIELKAWAHGPEALAARINRLAASYRGRFDRDDAYWFPVKGAGGASFPASGVRVRKEVDETPDGSKQERALVTFKTKEVREGIEVNDEKEFSVPDAAVFEELLSRLDLSPQKRKHKRGSVWLYRGITIELSEVERLGWFIEMEILKNDDEAGTVAAARSRLFELLAELEIPESALETRYYTEMLGTR